MGTNRREYMRAWRAANKERIKGYQLKDADNQRVRLKEWRVKNRAHIRKYQRAETKNKPELVRQRQARSYQRLKNSPERYAQHLKRAAVWQKAHPEVARRNFAKTRAKWPEKIRARDAVRHAIRGGLLAKPAACSACGSERALQAHHHRGYEKEHCLDVIWLCRRCHGTLHH